MTKLCILGSLWWTIESTLLFSGCIKCYSIVLANLQLNLVLDVVGFLVVYRFWVFFPLAKQYIKVKPHLSQSCQMGISVMWVKYLTTQRNFCSMLVERAAKLQVPQTTLWNGAKRKQLPLSISLRGKSSPCEKMHSSSALKILPRAQVALLLNHCRSLQLFLDAALRWEELGVLRASVVLLLVASRVAGAGSWALTQSGWQEVEQLVRSCLCQGVSLPFEVWLGMQLLEGSAADTVNTQLLFRAEQLIKVEDESAALCKIHVLNSQSCFWEDKKTETEDATCTKLYVCIF